MTDTALVKIAAPIDVEIETPVDRCLRFLNGQDTEWHPYEKDVEPYQWDLMGPYLSLELFQRNLQQCRANDMEEKSWAYNLHRYFMSCSGREAQKFVDALRASIPDEGVQVEFLAFMCKFAIDTRQRSHMVLRMVELCTI